MSKYVNPIIDQEFHDYHTTRDKSILMSKKEYDAEEKRLETLVENAKAELEKATGMLLEHRRSNGLLVCKGDFRGPNKGCGHVMKAKDITYFRTHWYEMPSGCTDGDCWHEGEGRIVCPKCGARTRLYDNPQFNKKPHLFKNVIEIKER